MSSLPLQQGSVLSGCTLDALLQSAQGVETWLARRDGEKCLLKLFREPIDAAGRRAIQRGFRRAQGVMVPGVVAPASLTGTPQGLVVCRPWVDGIPFFDAVLDLKGHDRVQRTVELAAALFATLAHLHRDGLVHGQLGPGNIWVAHNGRIELTDMGTSEALLRSTLVDLPGRLPPTAPEVAAGWGPRPATDIHAAGALLYAILAASAVDYTDQTTPWGLGASEALPPIPLKRTDVPLRLSELIEKTQALDWTRRPTASQLAEELSDSALWTRPAPLPSAPRRVGQDSAARAATEHLQAEGARLVVLYGPAGSGRHRLADMLMRQELRSYRPPIQVVADRAETGSLILRSLRRIVGPDQHIARRRRLLRDHAATLAALWPELGMRDIPPAGNADARDIIDAAVTVVSRSNADRPALFVFDRLEDADPLSLRFLHSLVTTCETLHAVAILDDRWQTDELRRMRLRLAELEQVSELTLPDLTAEEAEQVWHQLTKSIPDCPTPAQFAPASPARITEEAHQHLSTWLGVPHPRPGAASTLFAITDRAPGAALHSLGLDPLSAIDDHIAIEGPTGWLHRRHPGMEAIGARGLARRDKLADRLADALDDARVPPGQIARIRLLGSTSARTACARAAIAAHAADRPDDTRRWLHVVDRLPRESEDASYRALRAPLARVRAETAHLAPRAAIRRDLLEQAVRRARSPEEQADLSFLFGLVALRDGSTRSAARHWLDGARSPSAAPTSRVRCALHLLRLAERSVNAAQTDTALELLNDAARLPDLPRGPRRWIAVGRARTALARGQLGAAATHGEGWLASPQGHTDSDVRVLTAYAHLIRGDTGKAVPHIDGLLDDHPHHPDGLVLYGWMAMLRGDNRAGTRAHRRIPDQTDNPLHLPFEIALAASRGETHLLVQLLGRSAPSPRPDLYAVWLSTVLDALRTVSEPGLRRARLDEADADGPHSRWPSVLLARAWHHIDDREPDRAAELVAKALHELQQEDHPIHRQRALLMRSMLRGGEGWQGLVADSVHHRDVQVRYDVGELSARLAIQLGDHATAGLWVDFLSNAAVQGSDHALAARATRVHRLIQRSSGDSSGTTT